MPGLEAMITDYDDDDQQFEDAEDQDGKDQPNGGEVISDQNLLQIQRGIFEECISAMDKQKAHMWPANNIYNIVEYKQSTDDNCLMVHLIDELARQIASGKWSKTSVKHAFTILFIFNTIDEEVCKNLEQVRDIIGSSCMVDFHQTTAVFESQEIVHNIEYKKMFFVMEEALKLANIKRGVRDYENLESYKNKKLLAHYENIIKFNVEDSFSDWLFKEACLEFIILPNLLTKIDTCLTGLSCMAHFKSINLEIATDEKIHGCFFASVYNHVNFCLKRQSKKIQELKNITISICEMFQGVEFAKQCFYLMEMELGPGSYNITKLSKSCNDLIEHTFPLMYAGDRITMPQDGINADYKVAHEVVDIEEAADECVPITPYVPMSPTELLLSSGKSSPTSSRKKVTVKSDVQTKRPFKNKKEQEQCISGLIQDYKSRYMTTSLENSKMKDRKLKPLGLDSSSRTSSPGSRKIDKSEPPVKRSRKDDKSTKLASESKKNAFHEISDSEDEVDFRPNQSTKTIVGQIKQGGKVMRKITVVKD